MAAHGNSAGFGQTSDTCPDCGKNGICQSVAIEGDEARVVRSCRYCRAQWIDGQRSRN